MFHHLAALLWMRILTSFKKSVSSVYKVFYFILSYVFIYWLSTNERTSCQCFIGHFMYVFKQNLHFGIISVYKWFIQSKFEKYVNCLYFLSPKIPKFITKHLQSYDIFKINFWNDYKLVRQKNKKKTNPRKRWRETNEFNEKKIEHDYYKTL